MALSIGDGVFKLLGDMEPLKKELKSAKVETIAFFKEMGLLQDAHAKKAGEAGKALAKDVKKGALEFAIFGASLTAMLGACVNEAMKAEKSERGLNAAIEAGTNIAKAAAEEIPQMSEEAAQASRKINESYTEGMTDLFEKSAQEAEDSAHAIAVMQEDSVKKGLDEQQRFNDGIAEMTRDLNKQLFDLDENYGKQRRSTLESIFDAEKEYATKSADAYQSLIDAKKAMQDSIDDLEKNHLQDEEDRRISHEEKLADLFKKYNEDFLREESDRQLSHADRMQDLNYRYAKAKTTQEKADIQLEIDRENRDFAEKEKRAAEAREEIKKQRDKEIKDYQDQKDRADQDYKEKIEKIQAEGEAKDAEYAKNAFRAQQDYQKQRFLSQRKLIEEAHDHEEATQKLQIEYNHRVELAKDAFAKQTADAAYSFNKQVDDWQRAQDKNAEAAQKAADKIALAYEKGLRELKEKFSPAEMGEISNFPIRFTPPPLEEMDAMKQRLIDSTTLDHEEIMDVQKSFAQIALISKDIFEKALKTTADWAAGTNTEFREAGQRMALAMTYPERGMMMLKRSGVAFTQSQQDAVKQMVKTGDIMGAQEIILKNLSDTYGGRAAKATDTFGGRMKLTWRAIGEVSKEVGLALLPALDAVIKEIKPIAEAMQKWVEANRGLVQAKVTEWMKGLIETAKEVWKFIEPIATAIWDWVGAHKELAIEITAAATALAVGSPFLLGLAGLAKVVATCLGAVGLGGAAGWGLLALIGSVVALYQTLTNKMGRNFLNDLVDSIPGAQERLDTFFDWLYKKINGAVLPKDIGVAGGYTPPAYMSYPLPGPTGAYASGGIMRRAGMALVGEQGPELVRLPAGAQVYNAQQTRSMVSAGLALTLNVAAVHVREEADVDRIARRLGDMIETQLSKRGMITRGLRTV